MHGQLEGAGEKQQRTTEPSIIFLPNKRLVKSASRKTNLLPRDSHSSTVRGDRPKPKMPRQDRKIVYQDALVFEKRIRHFPVMALQQGSRQRFLLSCCEVKICALLYNVQYGSPQL